ncbi:MAG: SurA N-terminal domain-containing protein [Roseibacillus sp.]
MLATFRKYTGLMFVVLILLFVGLVFFGSSNQGLISGPKVIHAHGRGFTQEEFTRLSVSPGRMLRRLAEGFGPKYQAIDPYLRRMGVVTYSGFVFGSEQQSSYLVNRISLQQAMKEFGVYASTAEIENFLKETIFWEDGAFSEKAYLEFEEDELQPLGMTFKDLNELMGEIIALQKLEEILGAGVGEAREAVRSEYLASTQRVSYKLVTFPLTKYELAQDPSEVDIKTRWEENKGNYMSKSRRKLSYILARPDYVALEKIKQDKSKPNEGEDNKPATSEPELIACEPQTTEPETTEPETTEPETTEPETTEPKAIEPDTLKPLPPTPEDTALTPDERQAAVVALGVKFDQLWDRLYEDPEADLAVLAAKLGFEVKVTELVEKEALPAELNGTLLDKRGKTGADVIFERELGEPADVNRMGNDQWLLFRLVEVIDPKELSYEEARTEVRLDIIKERGTNAMKGAAKEKHAALAEALKDGKSFDDATEKLELKPIGRKDVTRPGEQISGAAQTEFELCIKTNPGALSEVFTEEDETLGINRSIFVFVDKREVFANPTLESDIDTQLERARTRNQSFVLDNWFAQRAAKADLKLPETK